jgi:predicted  nucleic acid-binding Zn-ribbon protein
VRAIFITFYQVKVERDPSDLARISELEASTKKIHDEMSYYKQELIDARARKSASDDELGTVRGKLETLENSISSLSNEGS